MNVSRRAFVTGVATALGYTGLRPDKLFAQAPAARKMGTDVTSVVTAAMRSRVAEYDSVAKLSSNENPWGPLPSVMDAMNYAWKYSNRYGYPDGGVVDAIAAQHGVKPENVLLGAGSGEILDVMALTFLEDHSKKVLGVEPTYSSVYQRASRIKADAIKLPLAKDYSQDIPAMIEAANAHASEIGFIYLCNPNNPTGMVVSKADVRQLLDGIPKGMPVMIDEAYHHFVQDPSYGPSEGYVIEGRPVVVARTFSKIFGVAGMRLGYGIAPTPLIDRMKAYSLSSINAIVKWGAVAGLADVAGQKKVLDQTIRNREKTIADLKAMGYEVLPSQTNFFMVGIRREVQPVIQAFKDRGVLVGRPFPPMTQHLRVSVGTEEEMARFTSAFKEIFSGSRSNSAGAGA
jgi:histidinol-phosphate aminotransferase